MKTIKAENITLDRIRAWLNEPDAPELSQTDRDIYDRWDYCYDQLKIEKPAAVIRRMIKKFDISQAQAYKDLQNCQKLLNPINRRELDWIRNFIVDDAILQMKKARKKKDMKAWEKSREHLIKIYALEKGDQLAVDPEKLGNNQYFILVNFGNKAEKVDLNNLHKLPLDKRVKLSEFLFQDASIEDAKIIMES